jgi:2-(1,2-epoxy-1,2-dihydrophenyl)acetyl-CoA isomerase
MNFRDISVDTEHGVARITISRPEKLNAMRNDTTDELVTAFDQLEKDGSVRAVILTGKGRAFGVGYDLSTIPHGEVPDLRGVLENHFNPLIRCMRASRLPIVTAINGPCAGVSVAVALSGDIIIAARSAYLYQPFVGISLVPDGGNSFYLPDIAGRIRASAAILLGDRVSAEEAHSWGLVWKVFDDEELEAKTATYARDLAAKSPAAISASKRLINRASEQPLNTQLDLERDVQGELGTGPEMKRAIDQFFSTKSNNAA